ncbi:hypothetical protein CAPTEDRAFT_195618 [Capitella teleta]|uniref:G-protein coupled receptors family 1 profile domain-containing protein n=1 Tax=Capitella teleta TaxID=283909 RepID=R7TR06_CAPTE|nr:hypothetical protein CAPTEDRAFT_195618 [Capitella teleta]|eukprot:ELT96094.1 hypothetical protein CAPTEDRAFT_195618 [Capitella teleta]
MATISTQVYSTESGVELQQELDLSQFYSCILYYFIFGSCIGGLLIVFGLAGNGITIVIMGRERKKSATINCLFMLAIADSFVLLTYGFIVIPMGLRKLAYGLWSGHNYEFTSFIYAVEVARIFNQVSAFIIMLVTFQRYVSVCLPHRAKQLCSVRLVNILTGISYIASILFFLPNFFTYVLVKNSVTHRYYAESQPLVLSSTFQILYATLATGLVTYVIPVSTLSFMSIQILGSITAQNKTMRQTVHRNQVRKDLTLSSIAIVVIFTICQSFMFIRRVLMWVYDPYSRFVRCKVVSLIRKNRAAYFKDKFKNAIQKENFRLVGGLLHSEDKPSMPSNIPEEDLAQAFNDFFTYKICRIRMDLDKSTTLSTEGTSSQRGSDYPELNRFRPQTEEEIREIIKRCPQKTYTLDSILTVLFKNEEVLNSALPMLTQIINLSLESGSVPEDFKRAVITSILKKKHDLDVNELKNYHSHRDRPTILLC